MQAIKGGQHPDKNDPVVKQYTVPPEKIMDVAKFCKQLEAKHPGMKPERILKKAVAHFKLKEKPVVKDINS